MKKIEGLGKILTRDEQKEITGGMIKSCSAVCSDGCVAKCTGSNCVAIDGGGCYSSNGSVNC